jgi:hypothetical protein
MLGQMNQIVKTLALSGLRSRYPADSPEMLRRRLADLLLGPALARRLNRADILSEPIQVTRTFREAAPNGGFGIWWLYPLSPALGGNACR